MSMLRGVKVLFPALVLMAVPAAVLAAQTVCAACGCAGCGGGCCC